MAERIWYRIQAEGEGPARVYLYGDIGQDWWGDGNSALDFARELDALSPRDIELRVNSGGGDVFEGMAIHSAIKRYAGNVVAYVDGIAASAASYLILAANEVVMAQGAFLMIHNAWTFTLGNAEELRTVAERLDAIDGQIVGIYDAACDKSAEEIRAAMKAETWLTSEQSVEWGFASRVEDGLKAAASISKTTASMFAHVPEGVEVVDEDASDTPPIIDKDDPEVDAAPGQEPEAVDEPQEPLAKTRKVALQSGIYEFPI